MVGLAGAIETSVRLIFGDRTPAAPEPTTDLDELIRHWTERLDADLLIIFDQFEEYLLYHPSDGEGTFAAEFPKPSRRATFGRTSSSPSARTPWPDSTLQGQDPNLLGNYYRVEHLDRESARAAILKPVERYNSSLRDGSHSSRPAWSTASSTMSPRARSSWGRPAAAPRNDLDDRSADRDAIPAAGDVPPVGRGVGGRLDGPSARDTGRLGGAERIVRTHLDEAMAAFLPSDSSSRRPSSASSSRRAGPRSPSRRSTWPASRGCRSTRSSRCSCSWRTSDRAGQRGQLADPAFRRAATGHDSRRFEIFHDVLAPAILDWRTRFEERRRRDAEERVEQESEARAAPSDAAPAGSLSSASSRARSWPSVVVAYQGRRSPDAERGRGGGGQRARGGAARH